MRCTGETKAGGKGEVCQKGIAGGCHPATREMPGGERSWAVVVSWLRTPDAQLPGAY